MTKTNLLIGADPFPPYQYYDDQGALVGLDYEKVRAAGQKAGFELEFILEDWALIEEKFAQKELDAVFQLPKTPEREKNYLFSKLLRNGVTEIVTGNPLLSVTAISEIGRKKLSLGLIEGIAYNEEIQALDQGRQQFYPDNEQLLLALGQQEVDFGVFDQGVRIFLMEKLAVQNITVIEALTFIRPLFMAFHDKKTQILFDKYL
ncbi:MAG: transporter substrate-binding domain-containing protein [Deltaproteobacteria bacterium]|jgi:ABC-type amino acid transport substrate-binding protein|nr:transporter substrate-binding domain-containing protein [Deltaproteobacteria bacterium]